MHSTHSETSPAGARTDAGGRGGPGHAGGRSEHGKPRRGCGRSIPRSPWPRPLLFASAVLLVLSSCATGGDGFSEIAGAEPRPELDPEEVVGIQLRALQLNDETDRGIEIVYRFASPANKAATGPLDRFARLFDNPAYAPMLNHVRAEFGTLVVAGDQARQVVAVSTAEGPRVAYIFALSRQRSGEPAGSWMTDAVAVVGVSDRPAEDIPAPPVPERL